MAERTSRPARSRERPAPVRSPSLGGGARGGPGRQLPKRVSDRISKSFGVDLSDVRVHTDATAGTAARALGARAFAVGQHIFLGQGQKATDIPLMAHEVAHVVQQQGAPQAQMWTPVGGDAYEGEARQASAAVVRSESYSVRMRTPPRVQRLGISDALDYFADKANIIPGYRMLTILIGVNPINMSRVERSAANILRALIELIPGGGLITQALDGLGIFEKAGAWVDKELSTLGLSAGMFKQALDKFLDSLGWRDIFHLGDVWDRAKRIFTDPIDKLITFGKNMVVGFLKLLRDVALKPLAKVAQGTSGYDLLKAVMGKDPITGEDVPQTAETLIGGFMKLIHQEEIWENIKKANAIPRAWAWFKKALGELVGMVRAIPGAFIAALKGLEIVDFILIPKAFLKLAKVFGGFVMDFFGWAGRSVLSLLKIIFEVLAPAAMPYLNKAAGAFNTIIKNPVRFIGNLVRAGVQGFKQFSKNFLTHLKTAMIKWLTGTLSGAAIYIPKGFELREIIKFVLSVLGLTWDNVRGKLVKAIGETAVVVLEKGFDIVVTLVKEGPAAAWEKIKEEFTNLREMVIDAVQTFVKERVVQAAIEKLLTSLNPAGAFIQAILAIYNTVMFFVERLKQIGEVVKSFIDSISEIAAGGIGSAANRVETTMAGLLTLVISFLARFAGLGKVSDAVLGLVNKVRAPIDKALDKVIDWVVATAKKLGKLVAQAGVPQDPAKRLELGLDAAAKVVEKLDGPVTASLINPLLVGVKVRYGFQTLEAVAKDGYWWVDGTVNPKKRKKTKKSEIEKAAEVAHKEVIAEMGGDAKVLLKGHRKWTSGHGTRSFSVEERNKVDDLGYLNKAGDHSYPSIKDPGTKPKSGRTWGDKGKGSWIPDHQPPLAIAKGGMASPDFRFYPHSLASARSQGGTVNAYVNKMKIKRKKDAGWAKGLTNDLFR
jgi:hypothetical protein